jgi:hypothetical protein
MPTKIFFAASEQLPKHRTLNKQKARYRLMTFWYLRKRPKSKQEELLYSTDPEDSVIFLDSGAATLMEANRGFLSKHTPAEFVSMVDRYVDDYCEFIQRFRRRLFCAVEMDIDDILMLEEFDALGAYGDRYEAERVRQQTIYNLRARYTEESGFAPAPILDWRKRIISAGVPVIVTWHQSRLREGWAEQCRDYPYVGIGSSDTLQVSRWFPYINQARQSKALVHGFAVTKPEYIRKFGLYSVDSSTWLTGEEFGNTTIFQNGRMKFYNKEHKDVRKRYKKLYESCGVDWKLVEKEDCDAIREITLIPWLQFSEHLESIPNKDYWTKEINGAPLGSLGPVRGPKSAELPPQSDLPENEEEDENLTQTTVLVPVHNLLRKERPDVTIQDFVASKMRCNNCYIQESCPFHEEDAECHFQFDTAARNADEMVKSMVGIIAVQRDRVLFGRLAEKADGGVLDKNLSIEVQRYLDMMTTLKALSEDKPSEEEVEVKAKGPGVVAMLLQSMMPKTRKTADAKHPNLGS